MSTPQPSAPEAQALELDISIVMPCLNEEGGVGECVQKAVNWMNRAGLNGEVIVVDNGSEDRSAEIAAAAGAKVVRESERGYGAALRRGFREARGHYMVMGDCDGTYEFSDLDPLVGPLEEGYDLVMGNRLTDQLAPGAMPWMHRFIGTPIISWVIRFFTGARVRDSQCGLRAMRRDAIQSLGLRSPGMEFASEMVLKAARRDLRIAEVPIPYNVRTGEAKLSTVRDGWRHLRFLLISSPSYVFMAPGLLFVLLGLISLIITASSTSGVDIGPVDWEPVFAAGIFFVVGVNALLLGLVSKLLGVRTGDAESRVVRFYHRYLGLEKLLALAVLVLLCGVAVELYVLIAWLGDSDRDLLPWAASGQALVIVGANLIFGALAVAVVDDETSPL